MIYQNHLYPGSHVRPLEDKKGEEAAFGKFLEGRLRMARMAGKFLEDAGKFLEDGAEGGENDGEAPHGPHGEASAHATGPGGAHPQNSGLHVGTVVEAEVQDEAERDEGDDMSRAIKESRAAFEAQEKNIQEKKRQEGE